MPKPVEVEIVSDSTAEYLDEQTEFFYRQLAYGPDFWRK